MPAEWWAGDEGEWWSAVDLFEHFVNEDGCQVCIEIDWRRLSERERAARLAEFVEHCVECYAKVKVCRNCSRCPEHAVGHCEDVTTRWSRAKRRVEEIYYEDHDWFEVPA